jgi:small-conductance mechanosensitive channel
MIATIIDAFKDNPWLMPAIFLGSGLLLGVFIDHVVLPILKKITARTKWEYDDIIIDSLRGLFIIWFGIIGAHLALVSLGDKISSKVFDTAADALKVIFIMSLSVLVARVIVALLRSYIQKSGTQIPGVSLFTNIARLIVLIMGALMALNAINIPIAPVLTALGVGGLAVALALQDTLSNLFAGIHIVASRQIKPGDYVKLDTGNEGYVTDVGWRNTTIKALANNMIIVPNSKVASAIITNTYQPDCEMGLGVEISVSGDSDLDKVERVTIEVAKEIIAKTPGVVNAGEPAIRYSSFADGGITFGIGFRVKEFTDQYLVKHEFLKALNKRYRAESIQLASPTRTIYVKEGSKAGVISRELLRI